MKIVIVGGGLAGIQTAYYLLEDGHQVTLVERRNAVALETSFANGGLITPSHAAPWNSPGILNTLLKSMGKRDASIYVKPSALGTYIGWGRQFIRNSTRKRYNRTIARNFALARYSQQCFQRLLEQTPLEFFHEKRGSMMVYTTRAGFEEASERFDELKRQGVEAQICSSGELVEREPALASTASHLAGGVFFKEDEHGDARSFTQSLAAYLSQNGVEMRTGVRVDGFIRSNGKIAGVTTDQGDIGADAVVIGAGHWSADILKHLDVDLPVRPVKGSSLTFSLPSWQGAPKIPVVDDELHVAVTPLQDSIRIVGTAEFCGYDPEVKPARMAMLLRAGIAIYPQLEKEISGIRPELEWSGHRPMTPDCMPILGHVGHDNLYLNTGHGYLGWTTATGTSKAIADMIAGRKSDLNMEHYGLARF